METVSLHYHWGAMTISVYHKLNNKCNPVTALDINGTVRQSMMILIFLTLIYLDQNESEFSRDSGSGGSAFQEKWLLLQSQINRIYLSYHMKVVINSVSLSRTYCAPQQVGALAHCTKWRWSHLWCTEGFFCCCQAMSLFPHHYWTCSVDVHRNSVYGLLIIHVFNVKPIDTVNFSVALFPPLNASPVIVCVWNTLSHWKIIWNTTLPSKMGLDPNSYVWRTAGWSVDISNRVQALDTWADALWSSSRNVPGFSVATIKQDTCNN